MGAEILTLLCLEPNKTKANGTPTQIPHCRAASFGFVCFQPQLDIMCSLIDNYMVKHTTIIYHQKAVDEENAMGVFV